MVSGDAATQRIETLGAETAHGAEAHAAEMRRMEMHGTETHVLGIDSGGSGVRVGVALADAPSGSTAPPLTWSSSTPASIGDRGIDASDLLARVLPAARELLREAGARRLGAVCVGAAGMATLGEDLRARLPDALADAFGVRQLALAADAVTAYTGALGQRSGAVVAAGTGLIALGAVPEGSADGRSSGWRRADGWGHLLGDCGGGAWIGRAGLDAAMRAYDGRDGGSKPLLTRLEAVFGPASGLPGKLYPRPDRPAVLASFAPEVGRCAGADPVAEGILRVAARHIAEAAEAVYPRLESSKLESSGLESRKLKSSEVAPSEVALTGGLFRMGAPLLTPVREALAARLPGVRVTEASGDPLDGALCIAAALTADGLRLPRDPGLLSVV